MRRIVDAALVAACSYHSAAILAFNLPANSPFGDELIAPFRSYVARAGLWQNWSMFHTIPYFSALGPKLVALGPDGVSREYDPVLPLYASFVTGDDLDALGRLATRLRQRVRNLRSPPRERP